LFCEILQNWFIFSVVGSRKTFFTYDNAKKLKENTHTHMFVMVYVLKIFSFCNHYYIFHILSKWKKLNFIWKYFSKMYMFSISKKKLLNMIEDTIETCNFQQFNNDVLKISFFNHIYISHTLSKWEKNYFILYFISQDFPTHEFLKKRKIN
jgi:hypothetical protein